MWPVPRGSTNFPMAFILESSHVTVRMATASGSILPARPAAGRGRLGYWASGDPVVSPLTLRTFQPPSSLSTSETEPLRMLSNWSPASAERV